MTISATYVIPADYGPPGNALALMDAAAYSSFVAEDWTLETIVAHFDREKARGTLLTWDTGSYGNWRVEVREGWGQARGFRETTGCITATGNRLHLTCYDELAWGAQFADARLPRPGTEDLAIEVTPGPCEVRVVQLYDPRKAESRAVHFQKTPHFALELKALPSAAEQNG